MNKLTAVGLVMATAVAAIVGCSLPCTWLQRCSPIWAAVPRVGALALFVWLLTLHPTHVGRVFAVWGGVCFAVASTWLWLVDGVCPRAWDVGGSVMAIVGMANIMFGPRAGRAVGQS